MTSNFPLVNQTNTSKSLSKSRLKPDQAEMLRFIKLLHDTKPAWFLKFRKNCSTQTGGYNGQKFGTASRVIDNLVTANAEGSNIAVAVNQIGSSSRTNDNVAAINAVFIDIDNGVATEADLMNLSLPPNVIVETSPKRYHAYWFVSNCTVKKFKRLQRALTKRFDSDPQVCDPARMMRLPGSINWNHGSPFLAQIIAEVQRPPVLVSQLVRALDLKVEMPVKSIASVKAIAANTTVAATGGDVTATAPNTMNETMKAKIRQALAMLVADDRSTWLRAGMAIHSVGSGELGYKLWTTWSKTGVKFDEVIQRKTWQHFKKGGGINIQSLFWLAARAGAGDGGGNVNANSFDDMDAAQLFASTFKGSLRFDPQMGLWYDFDGVVWRTDKQAPMRAAHLLVTDLSDGDGKKDPSVKRLRSQAGLSGMVKLAELETVLHTSENQFDQDANLLAVKNGVIDLRTGLFRKAKGRDYLRRRCDVAFDPDARCPAWKRFIAGITCGDNKLASFLQPCLGLHIVWAHQGAGFLCV